MKDQEYWTPVPCLKRHERKLQTAVRTVRQEIINSGEINLDSRPHRDTWESGDHIECKREPNKNFLDTRECDLKWEVILQWTWYILKIQVQLIFYKFLVNFNSGADGEIRLSASVRHAQTHPFVWAIPWYIKIFFKNTWHCCRVILNSFSDHRMENSMFWICWERTMEMGCNPEERWNKSILLESIWTQLIFKND